VDPSTHLPHGLLYGRNNISDPLDLALLTKESRLSVGTYLIIVDVIEELEYRLPTNIGRIVANHCYGYLARGRPLPVSESKTYATRVKGKINIWNESNLN